jgi:CxxC motif-containing protein (DUF1111 family)
MDGEAPADLVIQLGKRLSDGTVERGIEEYGRILNTSAIEGFTHEAAVHISYEEQVSVLDDGTHINLRKPRYQVTDLSGAALPSSTVLMPRMPPLVQGVGLLELVPQSELDSLATRKQSDRIKGHVSRINTAQGIVIGRFGWQATEPTVAAQTASAFAREMGLTTPLLSQIDCGHYARCDTAAVGGTPEVEADLFSALVFFQQLHAVPAEKTPDYASQGQLLFDRLGCSACHRNTLPVTTSARVSTVIHPYTDLLLHELGEQLADRDVEGKPVRSEWRTAPLWGLQASVKSNQPLRLLHDGRARSIEEAILWHDGEALGTRERYARLSLSERKTLNDWIAER